MWILASSMFFSKIKRYRHCLNRRHAKNTLACLWIDTTALSMSSYVTSLRCLLSFLSWYNYTDSLTFKWMDWSTITSSCASTMVASSLSSSSIYFLFMFFTVCCKLPSISLSRDRSNYSVKACTLFNLILVVNPLTCLWIVIAAFTTPFAIFLLWVSSAKSYCYIYAWFYSIFYSISNLDC